MSQTSTMYLTLTPTAHQLDGLNQSQSPIDHVTLNLAGESLSYRLVSGDKFEPSTSVLKSTSVIDTAAVSPSDNSPSEYNNPESSPVDEVSTGGLSAASTETQVDDSVLPPAQNDRQDTLANKHDTASGEQNPVVTTLPTKFLTPATVLKNRLENTKDLIVCPGVYDGFSARIALSVGFDALYMVGTVPLGLFSSADLHHPDWCWHYGLPPWATRSRPCSAK